jgi:hypothetical protein
LSPRVSTVPSQPSTSSAVASSNSLSQLAMSPAATTTGRSATSDDLPVTHKIKVTEGLPRRQRSRLHARTEGPHELRRAILFPRVRGRRCVPRNTHDPHRLSACSQTHPLCCDFSGLGDCPNKLILPFPGPEKVPNPYVRGHSSIGLFLTHSVESGYRGNLIHRSIWKGRFFEVQMQEPA